MELSVVAPVDGRVVQVLVGPNVQVEAAAPLVQIRPLEGQAAGVGAASTRLGPLVDAGPEEDAEGRCRANLDALRLEMLGFDVDPSLSRELVAEYGAGLGDAGSRPRDAPRRRGRGSHRLRRRLLVGPQPPRPRRPGRRQRAGAQPPRGPPHLPALGGGEGRGVAGVVPGRPAPSPAPLRDRGPGARHPSCGMRSSGSSRASSASPCNCRRSSPSSTAASSSVSELHRGWRRASGSSSTDWSGRPSGASPDWPARRGRCVTSSSSDRGSSGSPPTSTPGWRYTSTPWRASRTARKGPPTCRRWCSARSR